MMIMCFLPVSYAKGLLVVSFSKYHWPNGSQKLNRKSKLT